MHPFVRHSPCKILPVLDIQAGQVVRAVAGSRGDYQPWHSPLCPSADPCEAVQSLATAVGHSELYVADLDALQGGAWQGELLATLSRLADLWVDVGIRTVEEATRLEKLTTPGDKVPELGSTYLILASETCPGLELIQAVKAKMPNSKLAFSLDMINGQTLCPNNWINENNWLETLLKIWEFGIHDFLLIDLAAVGTGQGVTVADWCAKLHRAIPSAQIVSGRRRAESRSSPIACPGRLPCRASGFRITWR